MPTVDVPDDLQGYFRPTDFGTYFRGNRFGAAAIQMRLADPESRAIAREHRVMSDSNLEAWAGVIATRVGMDHLRAVYRRRKLFSAFEVPATLAVAPRAEQAVELRQVRQALSHLKPANAEVLFLHDALGYDLKEIAEQLGLTTSAAQSRLVRTRKDLLERLHRREGTKR